MELLFAVILGGFFGFALYKAGATRFQNIQNMLALEDLTLAKIILTAIGMASVLLSIAALVGWFNTAHINIKGMNLGVIIGGLIFGIGFGISGRCPGTSVAALGGVTQWKSALITVIGGLLGAFAFSLSYGFFEKMGVFRILNFGKLSLFQVSDAYPSIFQTGYGGLMLVGVVFILVGYFIPKQILHKTEG